MVSCAPNVRRASISLIGTRMSSSSYAMHAQRDHATCPHGRGAHCLLTIMGNQPGPHRQLRSLPWKNAPAGHAQTGRAYGRIEKRTLKAVTVAAGLLFPTTPRPSWSPALSALMPREQPTQPGQTCRVRGLGHDRVRHPLIKAVEGARPDMQLGLPACLPAPRHVRDRLIWTRHEPLFELERPPLRIASSERVPAAGAPSCQR